MEIVFEFNLTEILRGNLLIVAPEGPVFDLAADARARAVQLLYTNHGYDHEEAADIIDHAEWKICGERGSGIDHESEELERDTNRDFVPPEDRDTSRNELDGIGDMDDWVV